ncbi:hypothetical protein [Microcoleus sp. F4-D5]|uniref:hypothetical protein n=1 Tax=Microcoleus sp. F4-D5 TaxID=2818760 RepID=UPI002FD414AD
MNEQQLKEELKYIGSLPETPLLIPPIELLVIIATVRRVKTQLKSDIQVFDYVEEAFLTADNLEKLLEAAITFDFDSLEDFPNVMELLRIAPDRPGEQIQIKSDADLETFNDYIGEEPLDRFEDPEELRATYAPEKHWHAKD